jgi:ACS family D-galactonate transporter-like MFS transporter
MSHTISHELPRTARINRVVVLLGLSVLINYIDRANLSVAAPLLKGELHLSPSHLGILLSAFFWTYALMQPFIGWVLDRFEVKWVFAIGFFAWSAATAITGAIHGFIALLVMRVVLGLGESVAYPSYSKIFACHLMERQRGVANAAIGAGQALGPALGMLFGGAIVARFGWRPFFVVLGAVSLLWLLPWLQWMPRTNNRAADSATGPGFIEILERRACWGTCIGHFCGNYPLYFLLTWLPLYLVNERNYSMNDMAKIGGATFFFTALSALICGWLSDRWISSGATATRARKTFVVGGALCVGIFLAACVVASQHLSVFLLFLAGASYGLFSSNFTAITQTLAGPQAAGRWMGVQNFIGNLAGWVAPALTGLLVQQTGHYYWPFFIAAAVACAGAISWLFVIGPIEPVVWSLQTATILHKASGSAREASASAL